MTGRAKSLTVEVQEFEPRVLLSGTNEQSITSPTSPVVIVDPGVSQEEAASYMASNSAPVVNAPFPFDQTFLLSSRPEATKTIYLDFNGHVTSGTLWNSQYNNNQPFTTVAYNFEGAPETFTDNELEAIQLIWQRVAEDYSPFDVNVTTAQPPTSDLINSGGSDDRWGVRVLIGSTFPPFEGAGGVAFLTSFSWDTDTPALVFEDALGNGNEKFVAEAVSHEVGHTLGLNHDGRTIPSEEYYGGHGTGVTSWSPIMGVGYYTSLSQWSKGEYRNANNTVEDDLTIITTQNGFDYRVDDTGAGPVDADNIAGANQGGVFRVEQDGVIERPTDTDWYRFETSAGGDVNIQVVGAPNGPNLDIRIDLIDSNGVVIATANPVDDIIADLQFSLTTGGTYFLAVSGVGKGDPLDVGYTDYGSLGQYFMTGTLPGQDAPEIQVTGNAFNIVDGDATPRLDDYTDFNEAIVGGATLSSTFTVRNIGNVTLTLSGLTVPEGFSISDDLVASLEPGETDDFTIELLTAVAGVKTGDISFTTNDPNENPFNFAIVGTVNPVNYADIIVSGNGFVIVDGDDTPEEDDFTDYETTTQGIVVDHTFVVFNNGNDTLTLSGLVVPEGFEVVDGLVASLGAGESDSFTVRLQATSVGTFTGEVTFATNDLNENPFNFTIVGVVETPPDFDDQISEAIALGPIGNGLTVQGNEISVGSDVDMFSFVVAAGTKIGIDLDRPAGSELDSILRVFDAEGNELLFSDDQPGPNENETFESYVEAVVTIPGTYYVAVSAFPNDLYDAVTGDGDVEGETTGAYTLVFTRHIHAPTVDNSNTSVTYNEGDGQLFIDPAVVVNDLDGGYLFGAEVAITNGFAAGQDFLLFTSQSGIFGQFDPITGVMTLRGIATIADYQTALRSVRYINLRESVAAGNRTVTFTVSDGIFTGSDSRKLNVTSPNNSLDIRMNSAVASGSSVTLNYNIDGPVSAPSFTVGFYYSLDQEAGGDELLDSVTLTGSALTPGTHSVSFAIGSGSNQVILPGAGTVENDVDYYLLVIADRNNAIVEADTNPVSEDNLTVLSGTYRTSTGIVLINGSQDDDVVVIGTSGGVSVTVNGSTSTYAANTVNSIRARLHGGDDTLTNNNTKSLTLFAGEGDDTLIGPNSAGTWTINGANSGSRGTTTFTSVENLTGGSQADVFAFQGSGSISGFINGGGGTDQLNYASASGPVVFDMLINTTNSVGGFSSIESVVGSSSFDTLIGPNTSGTWAINAANAGSRSGFSFSSFENITAGSLDDVFSFTGSGSLSGFVDGGLGTNTLDFRTLTTALNVNLANGTSTRTGGIANFTQVITGSGNDTIVGNALDNILHGGAGDDTITGGGGYDIMIGSAGKDTITAGAGRSILIGGAGVDRLNGGGDQDLLIGSATTYDTNAAALNALMAEWKRTDVSYNDRIAHLRGTLAGGANGSVFLTPAKIVNDNAVDFLFGNGDLDWFWGTLAEVRDLQGGEVVTP